MNCTGLTTSVPRELPQVVRLAGVVPDPGEYTPPGAAEEDGRRIERHWAGSQHADKTYLNENTRSTVQVAGGTWLDSAAAGSSRSVSVLLMYT